MYSGFAFAPVNSNDIILMKFSCVNYILFLFNIYRTPTYPPTYR